MRLHQTHKTIGNAAKCFHLGYTIRLQYIQLSISMYLQYHPEIRDLFLALCVIAQIKCIFLAYDDSHMWLQRFICLLIRMHAELQTLVTYQSERASNMSTLTPARVDKLLSVWTYEKAIGKEVEVLCHLQQSLLR